MHKFSIPSAILSEMFI